MHEKRGSYGKNELVGAPDICLSLAVVRVYLKAQYSPILKLQMNFQILQKRSARNLISE